MSARYRTGLVIAWVVSVLAATAWARAQAPIQPRVVPLPTPIMVSGADIGFRVEGRRGDIPVGKLMIRKDAQSPWAEVEFAGRENPRPAVE